MRRHGAWANALLFVLILLAGLGGVVSGRVEVLREERRRAAPFPSVSWESVRSGRFQDGIEQYLADRVPFRSSLVDAMHMVRDHMGFHPSFEVVEATVREMEGIEDEPEDVDATDVAEGTALAATEVEEATAVGPAPDRAEVRPEKAGSSHGRFVRLHKRGLLYEDGRMMEPYWGGRRALASFARVVSRYGKRLAPSRVFVMVVPSACEFYLSDSHRRYIRSQRKALDFVRSRLSGSVVWVDAYAQLAAHTDEYIYFRTDHHWTARGAYYGYVAFCRAAGFGPLPLDHWKRESMGRWLGSLWRLTRFGPLQSHADELEIFLPRQRLRVRKVVVDDEDGSIHLRRGRRIVYHYRGYEAFLGSDLPWMEIAVRQGTGGRRLLVVKNSFANPLVPFLLPHYGRVYVLDYRYYDGPSVVRLVRALAIDDVLVVTSVFGANSRYHRRRLARVLVQQDGYAPRGVRILPVRAMDHEKESGTAADATVPEAGD